jgi:hypothetical protein
MLPDLLKLRKTLQEYFDLFYRVARNNDIYVHHLLQFDIVGRFLYFYEQIYG